MDKEIKEVINILENQVMNELDDKGRPSNPTEGSELYTKRLHQIVYYCKAIAKRSLEITREMENKGQYYMGDLGNVYEKLSQIGEFLRIEKK